MTRQLATIGLAGWTIAWGFVAALSAVILVAPAQCSSAEGCDSGQWIGLTGLILTAAILPLGAGLFVFARRIANQPEGMHLPLTRSLAGWITGVGCLMGLLVVLFMWVLVFFFLPVWLIGALALQIARHLAGERRLLRAAAAEGTGAEEWPR